MVLGMATYCRSVRPRPANRPRAEWWAQPADDCRTIMLPAPRQKPAQISPIFISDKVTLHVSREKDGKLRLVYAGWDDAKVVQPDGCGQARRGGRVDPTLRQGEGSDDPPFEN